MNKALAYDAVIKITFDSARTIDENGFMRVASCPITKEQVADYLGHEIPGYKELGLKPDKVYKVYRPASELSKKETLESVKGIPLLLNHAPVSPESPQQDRIAGSVGDGVEWDGVYIRVNLNINTKKAQDRIKDGSMRELSLGYAYTPVLQSGEFKGKHYDIVMRDIRANHLALVEDGRAGPDVRVCDSMPKELKHMDGNISKEELISKFLDFMNNQETAAAIDAEPEDEKDEVGEAMLESDANETEEAVADEDSLDAEDEDEVAEDEDEVTEDEDCAEDSDEDMTEDEDEVVEDEDEDVSGWLDDMNCEANEETMEAAKVLLASIAKGKAKDSDKAEDSARNLKRVKAMAAKTKRAKAKAVKAVATKAKTVKRKGMTMDSATLAAMRKASKAEGRRIGRESAIKEMRLLNKAAQLCAPILGKIDALAFDTAEQIYKHAALAAGMNAKYINDDKAAYGYVMAELKHRGASNKRFAMDGTLKARNSSDRDMREFLKGIEV